MTPAGQRDTGGALTGSTGGTGWLAEIVRYPVKGMPGLPMARVTLTEGEGLPLDRMLGLRNGTIAARQKRGWTTSEAFLRLLRNASLARYSLSVHDRDEPDTVRGHGASSRVPENRDRGAELRIGSPSGETVVIRLTGGDPDPRDMIRAGASLRRWFPDGPAGPVTADSGGVSLWDWPQAAVSLINLDTVTAMAEAGGVPLDHRRFRGNLYVQGLGAWRELDLLGQRLRLGTAELEIIQITERCRATTVNPGTGVRDLNVPLLLASRFGHLCCGVYARVVRGGSVAPGDQVTVLDGRADPARLPPADPGWPRWTTLTENIRESPTVSTFRLSDPAGLPCLPGQHLRVHAHNERGPLWRCYTITGTAPHELRISVKRVDRGGMSDLLHEAAPGTPLMISGPYGAELIAPEPQRPLLLAVAGIGVTPVLPVLRSVLKNTPKRPVTVVNVTRTPSETPLWEEVCALLAQLPNGSARLYVTSPDGALPPGALRGRPTGTDLVELAADPLTRAYLCGPSGFVQGMRDGLRAGGLPAESISDEPFFSPRPVPLTDQPPPEPGPFTVRFAVSGVEAQWTAEDGSLLELADAAGVALPSGCRAGACGACRQRVTGRTAHLFEPGLPMAEDEALLCCAVPVTDLTVIA